MIINIYLPSSRNFRAEDSQSITDQVSGHKIILGDFNSSNFIWESKRQTVEEKRSKIDR